MVNTKMIVGSSVRCFGKHVEPTPGPASGRLSGNPGWYNKRFEPSRGHDGNFIDYNTPVMGAEGFEPKQTNRDPSKFKYSSNIFKSDYWEYRLRAADTVYQIASRLHRSNDGWTRLLSGYTLFTLFMGPQALIWKMHFAFFSMALYARVRDKGAEPTVDEIYLLDTIFNNEKLASLFSPKSYHIIDYDQEWDEGRVHPYFPEYTATAAKFFNADTNSTTGMYKLGDVDSGAMMTLNFKTMAYSNNKYNFTEPFLVYDLYAEVTHNGNVFTECIIKAEDTLKTKRAFVPWH